MCDSTALDPAGTPAGIGENRTGLSEIPPEVLFS